MRVYAIRHGESEANLSKKWTGWADVHLTEKGREDAKKACDFLKDVAFDKIYTSDLSRAVETAEIVIPNCRYEISPLLREINVGTLAHKPLSVLTDEQRKQCAKHGYADFGGETKAEFYGRIHQVKEMLETLNCETVALFSHAGWLRGMLDTVVGTCLPRANVCCNNCTIAVFEFTGEIWRLYSWLNLS